MFFLICNVFFVSQNKGKRKTILFCRTVDPPTDDVSQIEHEGVECDLCKTSPIMGIRYQCVECADFDLCADCENSNVHAHSLIKWRNPVPPSKESDDDSPTEAKKKKLKVVLMYFFQIL